VGAATRLREDHEGTDDQRNKHRHDDQNAFEAHPVSGREILPVRFASSAACGVAKDSLPKPVGVPCHNLNGTGSTCLGQLRVTTRHDLAVEAAFPLRRSAPHAVFGSHERGASRGNASTLTAYPSLLGRWGPLRVYVKITMTPTRSPIVTIAMTMSFRARDREARLDASSSGRSSWRFRS